MKYTDNMRTPDVSKMIGKKDPFAHATKDSDRDGVINILDCEPHNPKKQGFVHTVGKWISKKAGSERATKWVEQKEEESDARKKVEREERIKQSLETAKYKEKVRGERQREYYKQGGFMGQIGRVMTPPKGLPKVSIAGAPITRTKKRKKKGTAKTNVRRARKMVTYKEPRSIEDFKLGFKI